MSDMHAQIHCGSDGLWRWALLLDGDTVAVSTEAWDRRQGAEARLDRILAAMHWQRL